MEVGSIGALTPNPATELAESGSAEQSLGQEAFLQLLVAQLKYQDPTSPADSQTFLAQTAQFTTVETLREIADSIAVSNRNQEMATIGALVGKHVEYVDALGGFTSAEVVAARTSEDGIMLDVGSTEILLDDVLAIVNGAPGA